MCIIHMTHVRVQVLRFKITFRAIPGGAGSVPDITMLPNMPVSPKNLLLWRNDSFAYDILTLKMYLTFRLVL